jgi:hypothetical protein
MFEKLPHPRILIDSPVYSSPGSQLRIRRTLRIFKKKLSIVSGRAYWDQEKQFDDKTGYEKSCDTVP